MVCIIQNGKRSEGHIFEVAGIVIVNNEEREIGKFRIACDMLDARNAAIDELADNPHFDAVKLYGLDDFNNKTHVTTFRRGAQ